MQNHAVFLIDWFNYARCVCMAHPEKAKKGVSHDRERDEQYHVQHGGHEKGEHVFAKDVNRHQVHDALHLL